MNNDVSSRINEPEIAQPANTALQIALVDLLASVGISATATIGHSSGEIAAAYALGTLSILESMQIAYFRGICAAELARKGELSGTMVAVKLSENDARTYINQVAEIHGSQGIDVACINSQKSVTISGDSDQVETLTNILDSNKIFSRKLKVPVAYHSSHMNQISSTYRAHIKDLKPNDSQSYGGVMASSVTGQIVDSAQLRSPDYWIDNLTSPVQFAQAFRKICTETGRKIRKKLDLSHRSQLGVNILLEIGPHATLQGPIRDLLDTLSWGQDVHYAPAIRRGKNAAQTFLDAVGQLHCLGYPVDLGRVNTLSSVARKRPRVLVNLPQYPFNHSTSYWRENTTSKEHRLAKQGRLDLLGKPVPDWNPLEAKWRHHIRCSEMPWVEDHVINGTLIYPAAGMLAMAIEAANQTASSDLKIKGFQLKDVKFKRALTIPKTADGVQTNLHLRTLKDSSNTNIPWLEFRLFSFENNSWNENCDGFIKVDYYTENSGLFKEDQDLEGCLEQDDAIAESCTTTMNHEQLYNTLNASGFEFGPTFKTIIDGKCNGLHQAHSSVKVFPWPSEEYPQPHVVHPTTLDGILHLSAAALSAGGQNKLPTAIPTGIRNLWVSKDGLSHPTAESVRACAWKTALHRRGHEFSLCALNEKRDQILAQVDGLQSTIVANHPGGSANQDETAPTSCYHIARVPDINKFTPDELARYCAQARPQIDEPLQYFKDVAFVLYKFLDEAIKELGDADVKDGLPHIHRYIQWARLQRSKYEAGQLPLSRPEWSQNLQDPEYFDAACNRVAAHNGQGQSFVRTGRNLVSILRGEKDPLQFLFSDGIMANFYRAMNNQPQLLATWGFYLRSLAQKKPTMKILEIGAGTGGTTNHVLDALSVGSGVSENSPLYMSYDFTDISVAFFEKAAERYKEFPRISFKTLDIEDDPSRQGFELGSYDLVIAANVLHATSNITETMCNVQSLLKPGGKLLLYETVQPDYIRSGFIAGLIEGWWAGEDDGRVWSPALTADQWDGVLRKTGFSGVDVDIPEYLDSECHESSVMISTASRSTASPPTPKPIYFVIDTTSAEQRKVYEEAQALLRGQYPEVVVDNGDLDLCATLPSLKSINFVFLQEMHTPLLSNMNRDTFMKLQNLVCHCNSFLWVTAGGGQCSKRAEYSIVEGWTRALRAEDPSRRAATLALEIEDCVNQTQVSHIVRVLTDEVLDIEKNTYEPEFVEVGGVLQVTRVQPNPPLSEDLYTASLSRQSGIKPIGEIGPVKLESTAPGLHGNLQWTNDKEYGLPMHSDEVEVAVKAVGLNFSDCQVALGKDPESNFGQECAGVVTSAGEASGFNLGDRVVAFGPGKFRTSARCTGDAVCRIPDNMPFTQAASMLARFGAAWQVISEIGRLQAGETILIHAGAGGFGQAAIQISQYIGAEVYATTSSQEKKQILMNEYRIPEDRIFYSRDSTFAKGVMRMTKGHGVDMVINRWGGEVLPASIECVAPYGRFVDMHKPDTSSSSGHPVSLSGRQVSYVHFDSALWIRDRPAAAKRAIETVIRLSEDQKLSAQQPLQVWSASDVEKAFRSMDNGTLSGKAVVEINMEDRVPTMLDTKVAFSLDPNATYVITGGLGGLGRAIARWMSTRGAKHLALLGRSGAKTEAAFELIKELETQGVSVKAPPCDVIDPQSVSRAMQTIAQTMPPIKGCVQGSMVLRDRLFYDMTYDEWRVATECKALGSSNLEANLPENLDFFILLSSASGVIGMPGQSNYAAGNAFMDSFARKRVRKGQKTISLDLGAMVDDGLLTETAGMVEQVLKYRFIGTVTRSQFLGIMDHYCNPERPPLTTDEAQLLFGFSTRGDQQRENQWSGPPIFGRLILENAPHDMVAENEKDQVNFKKQFTEASSLQEAREVVAKAIVNKLKRVWHAVSEDTEVDMYVPLYTYRVDSLLSVELCGWIASEFAADVATLEVMGGATLATLDIMVATRSRLSHPVWV